MKILTCIAAFLLVASNALLAIPQAYVIHNGGPTSVTVIDTANNLVVATIDTIFMPWSVSATPDGTKVYVPSNNTISVIGTESDKVIATINNAGGAYSSVVFTPDGTKAYAMNKTNEFYTAAISVIDTASNTVIKTINLCDSCDIRSITITPDGTQVYVGQWDNEESWNLFAINTATDVLTTTIDLGNYPGGESPTSVAITPDGTKIYAVCCSTVSVIDIASNTVIATISANPYPPSMYANDTCIAIIPDGTKAYVAGVASSGQQSNAGVSIIDTEKNIVIATIDFPSAQNLGPFAITPDGAQVYMINSANQDEGFVNIVGTTGEIAVGATPCSIAITPDGTKAYVVNYYSATISVIDTATNTVTNTIDIDVFPTAIAITPN